jgi:RNA polymerase sigma factor (sigma-70 family)
MPSVSRAGEVPEAGVSEQVPPEQIPPEWRAEVEECFEATAEDIYRALLRFAQGDVELARFLVQLTFQKATQKWAELRAKPEDIRAKWLFRVAVNSAIDVFRRTAVERQKWPQVRMYYAPSEANVQERAMANIAAEQFIKVIYAMPPQQGRVAFLYWRCEWTNGEIARALGISPACVSDHVTKARATLRKELSPYVPFEFGEPEGGVSP